MFTPLFHHSPRPVLSPKPDCSWASAMVLNPAMIEDRHTGRIHMLFRASAPCPERSVPGKDPAYPIFLGYAFSDDLGRNWHADFSRPALAPTLNYEPEKLYTVDGMGRRCLNYANGGIEDPRLFRINGEVFMTVACRIFAVGAYWLYDRPGEPDPDPLPDWVRTQAGTALGRGVSKAVTVNLLYRVDLDALAAGEYGEAFHFISRLTDPEKGEDRDTVFFPEPMRIGGRKRFLMLHRPSESFDGGATPGFSIWMAAAESPYGFLSDNCLHKPLASPIFPWEADRIGASWPPIRLNEKEWLLGYHGKQDNRVGYTQSFMILEERPDDFPVIRHRVSERLLYVREPWENDSFLGCPCLFTCSAVKCGGELVMGYGAADEKTGIVRTDFDKLVKYVRDFDADGRRRDRSGETSTPEISRQTHASA